MKEIKKMSTKNISGIQILLEAEKKADAIVQKGREYRIQKLKEAKIEAKKEIDGMKEEKVKMLADYQKKCANELEVLTEKIKKKMETTSNEIRNTFDEHKDEIIKFLLGKVIDVNISSTQNKK